MLGEKQTGIMKSTYLQSCVQLDPGCVCKLIQSDYFANSYGQKSFPTHKKTKDTEGLGNCREEILDILSLHCSFYTAKFVQLIY